MIVQFRVIGDNRWYYAKTKESEDWKFNHFTKRICGYICGWLSPEEAESSNDDDGVWFVGKHVTSFKEAK